MPGCRLNRRNCTGLSIAQQRDTLQAQLRQLDADIEAVTQGRATGAAAPPSAPATKGTPAPARPTLTDALVEVLREANRPLTARELGEELTRRKFPTTSTNITKLVENRVSDLVKRGVCRRAPGQPGVLLANPARDAQAAARKRAPAQPTGRAPQPGLVTGQPSLGSLLTELLQGSRKPVAARALADQVLATGYRTQSKVFTSVVCTALGRLEGVENVKGRGWRLKKA
jgi:hypothetical protein